MSRIIMSFFAALTSAMDPDQNCDIAQERKDESFIHLKVEIKNVRFYNRTWFIGACQSCSNQILLTISINYRLISARGIRNVLTTAAIATWTNRRAQAGWMPPKQIFN